MVKDQLRCSIGRGFTADVCRYGEATHVSENTQSGSDVRITTDGTVAQTQTDIQRLAPREMSGEASSIG